MKIYVHIGYNKTGTSAIQGFLSRNQEFLDSKGFVYPVSGRGDKPAHHDVAMWIKSKNSKELKKFSYNLKDEANNRDVIISSELLHTVSAKTFRNLFPGDAVIPIAYVRNHIDYINSWYRQGVKSRDMCSSFSDFAFTAKAEMYPRLMAWRSAFDEMIVRNYSRDSLLNGSSLDQFLFDTMGVSPESTQNLFKQEENASIGGNLLFIKRLLNNFVDYETASSEKLQYELLEIAQTDKNFQKSVSVPSVVLENLRGLYLNDVENVKTAFKVDISEEKSSANSYPCPNLETFKEDKKKILEMSLDKGFILGTLIQRHLGDVQGD